MGIQAKGVNKTLGAPPTHVLFDVDVSIGDGEFVSVTGKSGSGKSTLLYLLSTLDSPSAGVVEISNQDVARMSVQEVHEFRNKNIGFVFQFHYLLPELTALENVLMPAMRFHQEKELRPRALELLGKFGLADKAGRYAGQLSGGEQQRVAIARALIMRPKYIFADEPTGNLDSKNGLVVMELLRREARDHRTTVVYVTHDAGYAAFGDRQIELVDGRVVSS